MLTGWPFQYANPMHKLAETFSKILVWFGDTFKDETKIRIGFSGVQLLLF